MADDPRATKNDKQKPAAWLIALIIGGIVLAVAAGAFVGSILDEQRDPLSPPRTTDQGPASGPLPRTHIHALSLQPGAADILEVGTHQGLYESVDGGKKFTRIAGEFVQADLRILAFDPVSPDTVYGGGRLMRSLDRGALRTDDQGRTWAPIIRDEDPQSLAIDPSSRRSIAVIITGRRLQVSSDGGGSWKTIKTPFDSRKALTVVFAAKSSGMFVSGTGIGTWKSTDGGSSWTQLKDSAVRGGVAALAADWSQPGVIYAGGNGVFKSVDGGSTWREARSGAPESVTAIAVSDSDPNVLYAAFGETGGIVKSIDGGLRWRIP